MNKEAAQRIAAEAKAKTGILDLSGCNISDCSWEDEEWLADIQCVTHNKGSALLSANNTDEAFTTAARAIVERIKKYAATFKNK